MILANPVLEFFVIFFTITFATLPTPQRISDMLEITGLLYLPFFSMFLAALTGIIGLIISILQKGAAICLVMGTLNLICITTNLIIFSMAGITKYGVFYFLLSAPIPIGYTVAAYKLKKS